MSQPRKNKKMEVEWYSVSVASARRTIQLLIFVVLVIGAAAIYQQWENQRKRDLAAELIEEATELTARIEERNDFEQVRREYHTAWDSLELARNAYEERRFPEAASLGRKSLRELESVLQADKIAVEGRGRFVAVEGNVEYRRGDRGAWKRARAQDTVNPGDWVKTSAGASARIVFPGDSAYYLSANTLVNLTVRTDRFGRQENVASMQFGAVQLSTGETNSRVNTPKAEARLESQSSGEVSFDRDRNRAEFKNYGGTMEVEGSDGSTRLLLASQQVVQEGDALSAAMALPQRPRLLSPSDDRDIDLKEQRVRLTWAEVPGADSYRLQISGSPLFASRIIEDPQRDKNYATLGLQREGVYYWQVAAVAGNGAVGPWSNPRVFKVAHFRRATPDNDTPPALSIDDVQTFGSLLIVTGRSEPGVTLTVNGEEAEVLPDGSFSKTIQVSQEGFSFVEVQVVDARGNQASEQRRVFFDSSY
ncbi:MAG: hypothetical protein MPN21_26420 [Thermoanaerobaculia bacterium]|nr:hypothetical protein [Thermoanaerobaculia bacterium]